MFFVVFLFVFHLTNAVTAVEESETTTTASTGVEELKVTSMATQEVNFCAAVQVTAEKINVPGCYVRKLRMNKCVGACHSTSGSPDLNGIDGTAFCTCCQPILFQEFEVDLNCKGTGGDVVKRVTIRNPVECSCRLCR